MLAKPAPAVETHTTGLLRGIGLFAAISLVVGNVIGSGVFKKVAPMSAELQSPGLVLLAWLLAGIVTLCGVLTNAEIAGMIAEPGGQYVYFRRMYGKAFAFFYGWSCFTVIQCASQASIAYVFAESFNSLVPLPHLSAAWEAWSVAGVFFPLDNLGVKLLTVALLSLLTTINYFGVKYGSNIASVLASAVVVCLFGVILLGLSIGGGSADHLRTNAVSYAQSDVATSSWGFLGAIFAAMMSAFWAYDGWNNLGFLGGEIKNPTRTIPRALIAGVSTVVVVYLLANFTYLFVMPIEELIRVHQTPNAIAAIEVVRRFLGSGGALAVSLLILLATFNSTNTSILSNARIYFAMANDGLFFRSAATVHPRYRTPSVSLLMQGAWASVLVFSGSFDQLTDMLIFALFIFYGAGAFGVFVLRRKMPEAPRPYRAVGYPVVPALFVLFCAVLVVVSLFAKPRESTQALVLIGSGVPFYWFWRKRTS
ncbi:MAG: amino acid permease [Ferruginibacter sp.]|nr:amino acid permease [Cytophagales bacterium]